MVKLLFTLFCLPLFCLAQNTIGFPEVVNYSKQQYKGGLQSWDIKQDKNGVIYIANNEGLLSFDGRYWNLYPLPNKTIVRSVEIGPDNYLYVGGQDEMGYFKPASNGTLEYHSLISLIKEKDKSFGDIWDIVTQGKNIFFRSNSLLFQYNNGNITSVKAPFEWEFLGTCNGQVYAQDLKNGLLVFKNNIWQPVLGNNKLPVNDYISSITGFKNGLQLITTIKSGLYRLEADGIKPFLSANNNLFSEARIYSASQIDDNHLALATSNYGVFIIDTTASIVQRFSKTEQLQNNNVLSIFTDSQKNLWLGLDNGIDFIAFNSAIKHIKPMMNEASGYTLLIQGQQLYAGTSAGLFQVPLQPVEDLSFSKGSFSMVSNTNGQVWNLAEINNTILMGHHEGAFEISNNNAKKISSEPGFWNFVPLSSVYPAKEIAAGNYKGIRFFNFDGTNFLPAASVEGFDESSRFIVADKNNMLWISHPYHGVFRIQKNNEGKQQVFAYANNKGLPSPLNNHAYQLKNELVIATEKGIYTYNAAKDRFETSAFYNNLLGTQSIRYLKEDKNGNIWFIHEKTPGVIDVSENKPKVIYLPELKTKMLSGFELIYPVDDKNIFMGGEKGFYHINYEKYKRTTPVLNVQVRKVIISNQKDSFLFGGYFDDVNAAQIQKEAQEPSIAYRWKTIQFEFSSSLFGYQSNLEYSYRLIGFTDSWSEWSSRTEKEYTNLNAGNYRFEVKVRNNLGNESTTAVYEFTVLPPWYRTWWANTLYAFVALGIILFLYRRHLKKMAVQQQKFDAEQEKLKYIHELERNKTESELVSLRNEKLEAEIHFKNSEVASAAMHLVKKSELLTKMKSDLTQMMKRVDNEHAASEIKKMIKSLGDDEHIDEEWESFTKHFDKVHSDFVKQLKEVHPNLTGNELKLCTYLRMNLSTKEIAQLMNISVRGVEISRYRLRKKLSLGSEVSLFDYLLKLRPGSQ
jgi:ligand-binding sensor domain-containing protein/DNA-binding CsgD family transcriptional regulator